MKKVNLALVVIILYLSGYANSINGNQFNETERNHFSSMTIESSEGGEVKAPAQVTWDGSVNNNWHIANNWVEGVVPNGNMDVVIPKDVPVFPEILNGNAQCKSLFINSFASLGLFGKDLVVNEDMFINGDFTISQNSANLFVHNDMFWLNGSSLIVGVGSTSMEVAGDWTAKLGSNVNYTNGNLKFTGNESWITINSLNASFGNIRIESFVKLSTDIKIKGNLEIISDGLIVFNKNIEIEGNWNNLIGDAGFKEGNGRVIFNGNMGQWCSNERFNILELDIPNNNPFMVGDNEVYCKRYDWTDGYMQVVDGSFTADDLVDNGIFGGYSIKGGGSINLTNDSWVDLCADVSIGSGEFNVYGGSDDSYWTYADNASVAIDGGILNFHDVGIRLYNGGNVLNTNILDGVIRTSGSFRGNNPGFTPIGGTVECVSFAGNDFIGIENGSHFHNLRIEKAESNTMWFDKDTEVWGNLTVTKGELALLDHSILCKGDVLVKGKLSLSDNSILMIEGNNDIVISNGGLFESKGSQNSPAKVSRVGGDFYNFKVKSFAKIASEYTIFEFIGKDGIYIAPKAIVDPNFSFRFCTFRFGENANNSTLLRIDNDQNIDIKGATFTLPMGANFNVTKTVNAGNVTFTDFNGAFAGGANENDLFNRVHWIIGGGKGVGALSETKSLASNKPINLDDNNITLYPIPVINMLNIKFDDNKTKVIKIINLMGKTIVHKTITQLDESIDMSNFESGVYFVNIQTGKHIHTSKIIKK